MAKPNIGLAILVLGGVLIGFMALSKRNGGTGGQLTASFTSTVNGLAVQFTNTSQGAVSYLWDFGDGVTSPLQSPSHTYATAGLKTVTLTATSGTGATKVATQQVTVVAALIAEFTFTTDTQLGASFNSSLSQGAISYFWNFGDGQTAIVPNPVHTFPNAQDFPVTLTITGAGGATATITKTVTAVGTSGLVAGVFISATFDVVPIPSPTGGVWWSLRARNILIRNTGDVVTSYSVRLIADLDGVEWDRNRDQPNEWNNVAPGASPVSHQLSVGIQDQPGVPEGRLFLLERFTESILDFMASGPLVRV